MNYTNIEQSKKLLELGLSPESADMYWQSNMDTTDREYLMNELNEEESFVIEPNIEHCSIGKYDIPCWSVGALLELMPSVIEKNGKEYVLELLKDIDDEPFYILRYYDLKNIEYDIVQREEENLTVVLYQMAVWLLENKYINKGE